MIPEKEYCPICKMELKGNTHINDNVAWMMNNCEYDKSEDSRLPIQETEYLSAKLPYAEEKLAAAQLEVDHITARLAELKANSAS